MERCIRCNVSGNKVRLFDAIYDGKSSMICERCSIIENVPIIKKPSTQQLKESEKSIEVYERMKRLSGVKSIKKQNSFFKEDRLKELEKNPKLEIPEHEQLNLIDHFHWEIMKNRRRKGLSHKQLAETIGESQIALEMLEKGKLPEGADNLIRKLEQFFQVNLRKISSSEELAMRKRRNFRTGPVLLDEYGNELDRIPEPEQTIEIIEEEKKIVKKKPKGFQLFKKRLFGGANSEDNFEEEKADFEDFSDAPISPKTEAYPREFKRVDIRDKKSEFRSPYLDRLKNIELTSRRLKDDSQKDFELEKANWNRVTIGEMKEIHKRRLEVSKQERAEEQRKIEERQKLIEARKEELRLMKEKESRKIDDVLGGSELLRKKKLESDFSKSVKKFDEELV